MMKKCNLLGTVTFMVTLILLASCKKENNKAQTCGIVKESYVNGNDTIVWNYTYDVNGKLYKTDASVIGVTRWWLRGKYSN